MRKIIFIALIIFTVSAAKAQWLWDYGVAVGVSNYLGDIGGKEKTRRDFVADMKLAKTRWNVGGFARYKIKPKVSLKLALDYLRLEGDDKLSTNPARNYRNLNFRNDIFDLAITGEYFFYQNNDLGHTYRYKNGFRAYFFGGVGAFYNNPKALYQGQWVRLRPLHTEGKTYSPVDLNIPLGVGFYFTFNKKHRIGYEFNWRTTFTDYIDDVSGNYPSDPSQSGNPALSLRTPELGVDPNANPGLYYSHNWGQKRGDKTHKDSYITMSLTYSYVIRGKSSFYRGHYGNFFGKKGHHKVRKIRSKF
ncbi:MAG: outer membrane beta-barrel protein [Bacteroidetes bacterium]|nr:outer membrane beta-barrel protein [Bacteroidota bacterium]